MVCICNNGERHFRGVVGRRATGIIGPADAAEWVSDSGGRIGQGLEGNAIVLDFLEQEN